MMRNHTPALPGPASTPRRRFLFETTAVGLSGAAVALLAGAPRLARAAARPDAAAEADQRILATALAAEREAVAAYQLGADSGLLQPPVRRLALQFQGHHKAHADVLAATISKLGGTVANAPERYDFPADQLQSQHDVLHFAAGLEHGAVGAYAGAIRKFEDRELSHAAATILADEAMHWAVLRQALKLEPVPGAFIA